MNNNSMKRRKFLKQSALGLLGIGSVNSLHLPAEKKENIKTNRIMRYNTLGRTGFKVSDVVYGNPKIDAVINAAMDAGINYFDTGETYGNGNSERSLGKAIKGRDRKSIFITTKLPIKPSDTKENILRRARKCLERLDTDYIDCLMIHNATDVKTISHEGFHSACKQLKQEGRLKFVGITSHGQTWWKNDKELMTRTMENVLLAGAMDGRFDLFMFVYNFLNKETGDRIIKICKEKNIGTIIMKFNPVNNFHLLKQEIEKFKEKNLDVPDRYKAALKGFQRLEKEFSKFASKRKINDPGKIGSAAFRFVSKHPDIHSICCAMPNFEEMEHWISLSGSGYSRNDKDQLSAYEKSYGRFYCRHACGVCESSCPDKIPINTIMRYNHYFDSQKREKDAMSQYSRLDNKWSENCKNCSGNCEQACPYKVPIQSLLGIAHNRLTIP